MAEDEIKKRCSSPKCSRAGQLLPLTEFYKDSSRADGTEPRCKECSNAKAKKYKRYKESIKECRDRIMKEILLEQLGLKGD